MVSCKAISRLKVWEPVALVLLVMGVWECGLGWAQLFGIAHSRHALYPATGTFYNPGPFCGFLAMILPAALQYIISPRQRLIHWVALAYFITAVAIMPVLMGRTGWIAAVAGCLVAAAGCGKIRRPRRWMLPAIAVASAAGVGVMLYLKPASALGRLLLWRIGVDALMEHPLTGVGWHHVAGALGQAQEAYFHYRPYSCNKQILNHQILVKFNHQFKNNCFLGLKCVPEGVHPLGNALQSVFKNSFSVCHPVTLS